MEPSTGLTTPRTTTPNANSPAAQALAKTSSTTTRNSASIAENFDNFLSLLTTQLKHQDPLSPMDTNQFVEQLVQFTQVEQSINTNRQLEQLIKLQTTNQAVGAIGYIGKTIEAAGDTGELAGGKATFTYTVEGDPARTSLVVVDEANRPIFSTGGKTKAGKHEFVWDGRDKNGKTVPDGTYRFKAIAVDKEDQPTDLATGVIARVAGVETVDGQIMLSLGKTRIALDTVTAVRETAAAKS